MTAAPNRVFQLTAAQHPFQRLELRARGLVALGRNAPGVGAVGVHVVGEGVVGQRRLHHLAADLLAQRRAPRRGT